MQTQNPFLDEMAKLTTAAMGLAQAASDEAKAAFRSQADRIVADLDLVRREELDGLKAEIAALRGELESLKSGGAAKRAPKSDKSA
jgi:BMFP domain-containing protein YqiC